MLKLKQLLADMAGSIVDYPDEVRVLGTSEGDNIYLELNVAESDMGKVIGRHGKNARSLRAIMKAAGNAQNKKVTVEIK